MSRRVSSPATFLRSLSFVVLLLPTIGGAAACNHRAEGQHQHAAFDNSAAAKVDPSQDVVARGKYLVTVAGCNDCHTPLKMGPKGPEPDMSKYLSGHPAAMKMETPAKLTEGWLYQGNATNTAFAGPWGVSYAINLTSDEQTGIGSWQESVFVNAMRTGKHLGVGRPIMPPMPWPAYAQMTDEDLKAMFAYLKTVPAQRNKVPDAVVAPPPPARTN